VVAPRIEDSVWLDHVEKRFAQAVRGGAGMHAYPPHL
jgi:hypothetical protein